MIELLFQDESLRHCTVKGVYALDYRSHLLEVLNTFQDAVPKERHVTYPQGKPKEEWRPVPSICPCVDGILLNGKVTISGDDERAPVGAIIYRSSKDSPSSLYLVKLAPKALKREYKVQKMEPKLPEVLEKYIDRIMFSKP